MHLINLAANCLNEIKYYNSVSTLFYQDCNTGTCTKPKEKHWLASSRIKSPEDWIKINVMLGEDILQGQPLSDML